MQNTDNILDIDLDDRPDAPLVPHLARYYGMTLIALFAAFFAMLFAPPLLIGLEDFPFIFSTMLGLIILVLGRYFAISSYFSQNKPKNRRETAMRIAKWNGGFSVVTLGLFIVVSFLKWNGLDDAGVAVPMGLFGGLFGFFLEIVCNMMIFNVYNDMVKK